MSSTNRYKVTSKFDQPPLVPQEKPLFSSLPSLEDTITILKSGALNQTPVNRLRKTLDTPLTENEGIRLVEIWRFQHWAPLNEWVQVSGNKITYEFSSDNNINKRLENFTCNCTIEYTDFQSLSNTFSEGIGKSKKEAKKNAMENMTKLLCETQRIHLGLKSKGFLFEKYEFDKKENQDQAKKDEDNDQKSEDKKADNIKNDVQKLCRIMKEKLQQNNFQGACQQLCMILMLKKPEWQEISHIWCYALLQKNFNFLKSLLDMIQYKSFGPTNNIQQKQQIKIVSEEQKTALEKTKATIKKLYGDADRMQSDNPYDIVDYFNVTVNNPEIDENTEKVQEDDLDKQLLSNAMNQKGEIVKEKYMQVVSITYPEQPIANIQQQQQQLLEQQQNEIQQQEAQDLMYEQQKQNQQSEIQDILNEQQEYLYQKDNLNQELLQKKYMQMISTGTNEIQTDIIFNKQEFENPPVIDETTAREIKDPNINYLSYNLLNEFYDVLLYLGDLNFALRVAELIYTKVKLDDSEFINSQACSYYTNKKNMIVCELLETIFQVFSKSKSKPNDFLTTLYGKLNKIGEKQAQYVMLMEPYEKKEILEYKLQRKGFVMDNRENYHMISEGEFVMLTSGKANTKVQENTLASYLNQMSYESIHQNYGPYQQINPIDEGQIDQALIAQVKDISKDYKIKMFILPNFEQSEALLDQNRVWRITKLINGTSVEKTSEGLLTFCTKISMSHVLLQILLTPPICNQTYVKNFAETKVAPIGKQPIYNNLNHSQNKALKIASTNLLTLIQGPPGTGKTTTAVEIVLEWLRQSSAPILACAESNIAVDLLHNEFQKAGIKAIRIGPGNDEKNEYYAESSYRNYAKHVLNGDVKNAINAKYGLIKRKLEQAQVVCATCVGSTSEYLKEYSFTRVVVDEATQANEISCLVPLINGTQQLVLIGDHKQLPPTVLSVFAQSKGMTISLFERLVKQGVKPQMLTVQYRMHPTIALFPSYQFYNNMLENGVGEQHRPIVYGFNWPNNLIRVAIVNVKGHETVCASSMQNTTEVEVVIEVLMQLLKAGYIEIQNIGIITPYDAQKRRIRNEINIQAKKFPKIFGLTYEKAQLINRNTTLNDVDTVDGYQGMERDIIIFSAVRSNSKGNLGFLKDPRRMNVTLTRAKRGLIIIGDIDTLGNDSNWKDLITWARSNKLIVYYKQL